MNPKELMEKRASLLAQMEQIEKAGLTAENRAAYEGLINEADALAKDAALTQRADQLRSNPGFQMPKDGKRQYSLLNVMRSMAPSGGVIDIGFEREVSQELARGLGSSPSGLMVPFAELFRAERGFAENRSGETTTTTAHGIVATQLGEVTGRLYPETILSRLGVRELTGLTGNIDWPVQSSDMRPAAKGEIATNGNINAQYDPVSSVPHRVGANYPVSMQLLMQTGGTIESFLREEINLAMQSKLDYMFFNGTGSGAEMLGLLNLANLGSYTNTGGTLSWANALAAKKQVQGLGLDQSAFGWALGTDAWAKAAATALDSGSGRFVLENDLIAGYRTATSDNVGAGNALLLPLRSIYLQYWGAGIDIYRNDAINRGDGQIVFNCAAFANITVTRPGKCLKNSVTIS